jgi:hypothetical protein
MDWMTDRLHSVQIGSGAHPAAFTRGERQKVETDHSNPARGKNGGAAILRPMLDV